MLKYSKSVFFRGYSIQVGYKLWNLWYNYDIMVGVIMDEHKVKSVLKAIYEEMNIEPVDEEYNRYLEEKILMVYNYEKEIIFL